MPYTDMSLIWMVVSLQVCIDDDLSK